MAKNLVAGLVCVGAVAACGGGGTDGDAAAVSSTTTLASVKMVAQDASVSNPTCNLSDWVSGKAYGAGSIVKYGPDGKYYQAAHDNPGYDPAVSTWYWTPFADWVAGQSYTAGTIVRFGATGNYYKAVHDNPGYDPTVSTWYWSPFKVTDWAAGQSYAAGDIVKFGSNGKYYQAAHDNPGYDPTVSTWFWSACSNPGLSFIVTEAQFNQMFPNRNPFYTYAGLVEALNAFPGFAATGDSSVGLQEAAAFLANVMHETGGLQYINELNQANWPLYCESSTQYPCAPGKEYYGRGPLQISWNYNYDNAGKAFGVDLLNNPDLVSQDAAIAWKTALWFWMTMKGAGTMTGHDAMVNAAGFGETIRSINGALECGKPSDSTAYQKMQARVTYYTNFTQMLGVGTGGNLTC